MDKTKTTHISYSVIDSCIRNLDQSIHDKEIDAELEKLTQTFSVSTGRTKEEFEAAANELKEVYQIILNRMLASKDMLAAAKKQFQNLDEDTKKEIGGRLKYDTEFYNRSRRKII